MNGKQEKYIRALLALVGHDVSKSDHEEIASILSPEACNELADNLMLLQIFLERFEKTLRAAGQVGTRIKGLVR